MPKPVVSIVKHKNTYDSLREALELCGGLKGFNKSDKILIKPNLVAWDFDLPFPPFGVITTTSVIFALVQILAEEGFTDITVGEASLPLRKKIGEAIYRELGYEKLKEKFGVKLVDFNEEKFEEVDFGDFKLFIAQHALKADKVINVPVLKTHNQAKVSLGLKNMKGCLNRKSKIYCHNKDRDLNHIFPRIIEKVPVALTVIDGIFVLEKGPAFTGKAYRKDIIVASRDAFACDVVGANLLGYDAGEVPHLQYFAGRHRRKTSLSEIEIRGEDISQHKIFLEYDWEWMEDNSGPVGFKKRGITGLVVRKYDNTLCTGCSRLYNPMLILLMSAYKGKPFPGIEVLSGKIQKAAEGFEKTVLFGNCSCVLNKNNPNIKKAIPVKGCPPNLKEFEKIMKEEGIECDYSEYVKYRHYIFDRYAGKEGFDMGLYVKR